MGRSESRRRLLTLSVGCAAWAGGLAACGGGGSDSPAPGPAPTPPSPPAPAPGGLYLGYYAEDPASNPEDPTLGALSLSLPSGDSNFAGSMYFTFVGCQASNVGTISGAKTSTSLVGSWTGSVDGRAQNGSYVGAFDAAAQGYAGTYTVAGGKQQVSIPGCIDYIIAPGGTWELFAAGGTVPAGASAVTVGVTTRTIAWPSQTGATGIVVCLVDELLGTAGAADAIRWQELLDGTATSVVVPAGVLTTGRRYLAAVAVASGGVRRYVSSVAFTAA